MLTIKNLSIPGYETVIEAEDSSTGLSCYIAIHDTTLGPALGGTRIFPYLNKEEALHDVLRLAKAMTYKSAVASDGLGGGKSVIIANPKKDKTEKLLLSFGEVINSLKGAYIAAEDVGSTIEDMTVIRKKTPYVAALPTDKSSGDPSRFTAWGVFRGIQAVLKKVWHTHSLKKKVVSISGVGNVGSKLANILFWEGADLILSDTDQKKVHEQAILYGARVVSPEEAYQVECDIFSPCSLGGVLSESSVPLLKCKAVAGAANNQLSDSECGKLLMKRNILYAPDYIINAGGILNAAAEFDPGGYDPTIARDRVNHIYDTLRYVFNKADFENKPTSQIADELAEHKLQYGIGKRRVPIFFEGARYKG